MLSRSAAAVAVTVCSLFVAARGGGVPHLAGTAPGSTVHLATSAVTTSFAATAPATTATAPPVRAATAPATTTPSSVNAPQATVPVRAAPTTVAFAGTPTGAPWFAALRADGTLEAWAKDGKRVAVPTCAVTSAAPGADPAHRPACSIADVAISDHALWYLVDRSGVGATVFTVPLAGGTPQAVAGGATPSGESYVALAVTADGTTVWATHEHPVDGSGTLDRIRGGSSTTVAAGVAELALSPDGHRLAYVRPATAAAGPVIVVREVSSGVERSLQYAFGEGPPVALAELAWASDSRHLSFETEWEGRGVYALDVDSATSANDAVVPRVDIDNPHWGGVRSVSAQQACWTGPTTMTLGTWYYPYADELPLRGDVVAYDLATGAARSAGASVFGQGYGSGMACRDDGAVALIDAFPADDAWLPVPGDLVVVRADGTPTVLGRHYQRVFTV